MGLGLRAREIQFVIEDAVKREMALVGKDRDAHKDDPGADHPNAIHIWGPPGIGKSAVAEQVAAAFGIGYIDTRLLLLDPTDLRGIPFPQLDQGFARWLQPSFLPDVKRHGRFGIWNLDELVAAPPLVQGSAYQPVWDRRLGEWAMPDGWILIATGNRMTDRAISHRMPTPLKSRFHHIHFGVGFGDGQVVDDDLEDWTEWAIAARVNEKIIGFINFKPDSLFKFKPDKDEETFACPRTWAMASGIMGLQHRERVFDAVLEGTVGGGAAAEFKGYLKVYSELPDIDKILGGGFTIPERRDLAFAVVTSLAVRAEAKHADHLLAYSHQMPDGMEELAVLLVKLLKPRMLEAITRAPSFKKWIGKFSDVLLV